MSLTDTTARRALVDRAAADGLVLDGARTRPRYFDGRLLTAADLTRDQDYMRRRQADLARAAGAGVVAGLAVSLASNVGLRVEAGHGITPGGSLVIIDEPREIRLVDLASTRRLDATLGLANAAAEPPGQRTGLYVLALRPMEFSANPTTAYPTRIDGPRRAEYGDIVEATAVTLIRYPTPEDAVSLRHARSLVARDIFVAGGSPGALEDALPLAMVALDRDVVIWLDMFMVRRETGADTPLQVGMGVRPRPLAEAHLIQHSQHFADIRETEPTFQAARHFAVLPPAGRLPAASIVVDAFGFLQSYFPPAVDVDVAFVPSDELAALVEESLLLPPIDLAAPARDLDATAVIVLAPVKRPLSLEIERLMRAGAARARSQAIVTPREIGLLSSQRLPELALDPAAVSRALATPPAAAPADFSAWGTAWQLALANLREHRDGSGDLLWYVRRRTVPYRSRLEGFATVAPPRDPGAGLDGTPPGLGIAPGDKLDPTLPTVRVADAAKRYGLGEIHAKYLEAVPDRAARAAIDERIAGGLLAGAPAMTGYLLVRLALQDFKVDALAEIVGERPRSNLGLGLARLGDVDEPLAEGQLLRLAEEKDFLDLDQALAEAREDAFQELRKDVLTALAKADSGAIRTFIDKLTT